MLTKTTFTTFYSYKGGVGRTLALGNVAWTAALNGKKVVIIDFDLEAPGISYIESFREFVENHKKDKNNGGIFDLILEYQQNNQSLPIKKRFTTKPITKDRIKDFNEGKIYIIPAGRDDNNYKKNLQLFNWQKFYSEEGGREFFFRLRERIEYEFENPDYVFIDSKDGLTDIGGLCSLLIPDIVVILTGLNQQNLNGTQGIINSINEHSKIRIKEKYLRPIEIITVASHVPLDTEYFLTREQMEKAAKTFGIKFDISLYYVPVLSIKEILLVNTHRVEEEELIKGMVSKYQDLYYLIE